MKRACLVLLTCSCAALSTREETATADMSLYFDVASSGAGTHVESSLTGPFGLVSLGQDDSFGLSIDGSPAFVLSNAQANLVTDVPNRAGVFAFTLHHANDSDFTVQVELPAPSQLAATATPSLLTLTWTPSSLQAPTSLDVIGICVLPFHVAIQTDTGQYLVPASVLQVLPAPCTLTISLHREVDVTAMSSSPPRNGKLTQTETTEIGWSP